MSLVLTAWIAIRAGNQVLHKRCLFLSVVIMVVFLISYLTYHFQVGIHPFLGEGWTRTVYYTILITHILMSLISLFLVPITFILGIRQKLTTHRKIARWTMPIWLYASSTGLVVYWMIYHLSSSV